MNTIVMAEPVEAQKNTGIGRRSPNVSSITASLHRVLAYENEAVIVRIAHEEKITKPEAEVIFKDTLRFLWLGHQAKMAICPTKQIDAGWHIFLLFTQDYREFCQAFFGEFIDHHPRRPEDEPDGGAMARKSRALAEEILVGHAGVTLSGNWEYPLAATGDCCGNCGSDCCKR